MKTGRPEHLKSPQETYCPRCGAPGKTRERRPNGNDTCSQGHTYPSVEARTEPLMPHMVATVTTTTRTYDFSKELLLALMRKQAGIPEDARPSDIDVNWKVDMHGEEFEGASLVWTERKSE